MVWLLLGCAPDDRPPVAPDVVAEPTVLRRLTVAELDNLLADVLLDLRAPSASHLPEDAAPPFGNVAADQTVSRAWVEGAAGLAQDVVGALAADPDRVDALLPCPAEEACYGAFTASIGRPLLRRALTDTEVETIAAAVAAAAATDPRDGYGFVLEVLLQDAEFLYQVEPEPSGSDAVFVVGPDTIAARMALALWGSAPDAALFAAADAGRLADGAGRAAEAERMLADPRGARQARAFHALWLGYSVAPAGIYSLDEGAITTERFTTIAAGIRGEADALVTRTLLDEDAPWTDLFWAPEAYLTPDVAALYGVPGAASMTAPAWVDVSALDRRGILSTTAWLAGTARTLSTSPTLRGKVVRERLLCDPLDPPPDTVVADAPPPGEEGSCKADRYATYLTNTACVGCHAQMDGIGNGLERYDYLGRYTEYEYGDKGTDPRAECPIAGTGDLDGAPFSGPTGLAALLKDDDAVRRCMVEQLLAFSTGQTVSATLVDALLDGQVDLRYRQSLLDWVGSDTFVARVRQ